MHTYTHIHTHTRTCTHTHTYAHIHTYTHIHTHTCTRTHAHTRACTHKTHTHMHTHTHTLTHTHIQWPSRSSPTEEQGQPTAEGRTPEGKEGGASQAIRQGGRGCQDSQVEWALIGTIFSEVHLVYVQSRFILSCTFITATLRKGCVGIISYQPINNVMASFPDLSYIGQCSFLSLVHVLYTQSDSWPGNRRFV